MALFFLMIFRDVPRKAGVGSYDKVEIEMFFSGFFCAQKNWNWVKNPLNLFYLLFFDFFICFIT